jgi:hypothetical protein
MEIGAPVPCQAELVVVPRYAQWNPEFPLELAAKPPRLT